MSIAKLLVAHECEALFSGANSAIWHSHQLATRLADGAAREEDHVATLVTDGVPFLVERWTPLLQPKGISLRVSGVFCHGHPQVAFGTPRRQVELADLLVVHQHTKDARTTARAILVQAKMSADSTHSLPHNDAQLDLFSKWPPFEFVTGGLSSGIRDLKEVGKGSRYALVLDAPAYPEQISWADQCPWAASRATQHLSGYRSLAKLLGDMLLGKDGRTFQLGKATNDWSRTIQELLKVTGQRTYRRANIKRGPTPRVAGMPPTIASFLVMSTTSQGSTWATKTKKSLVEQFFSAVPLHELDGDGGDPTFSDRPKSPDRGISALIVETVEGQD